MNEVSIILKNHLNSTIKSEDTEVLGGLRDRPNEIKPYPVDQPERTGHYDCAICASLKCYTILGYSTETVLLILNPFLQTNITVQVEDRGVASLMRLQAR